MYSVPHTATHTRAGSLAGGLPLAGVLTLGLLGTAGFERDPLRLALVGVLALGLLGVAGSIQKPSKPSNACARSLAGGLLLVGVFTLGLLGAAGTTLTTALLFCARAASMGAFAILYVYTPEARGRPRTSLRCPASVEYSYVCTRSRAWSAVKLRMRRAVRGLALLLNKLIHPIRLPALCIPEVRLSSPRNCHRAALRQAQVGLQGVERLVGPATGPCADARGRGQAPPAPPQACPTLP